MSPGERIRGPTVKDSALHLASVLFAVFSLAVLAAACGTLFAWPVAVVVTAACAVAVRWIARA